MTLTRKLLRDYRAPLLVVMFVLGAFQCLWAKITERILGLVGEPSSLVRYVEDRPGHDRRYALDSTRLRATGWRPRRPSAEGLAATVDWYRHHRAWWEAVKSGAYRDYYEQMYADRLRTSASVPREPGR